jgi:hypothetical protein
MKRFFLLFGSVVFLLMPVLLFAAEENKPDVSDSWLKEAMENIKEEEYKPSLQESDYKGDKFASPEYHFANRAGNLRAYFDKNGMELIPRVITDEGNWNLKIKSIAVTSGNNHKKIFSNLAVTLDGDNIKCTGNGIEVVYSNSESGIEQNLSIEERIEGEGILSMDFIVETENLDIAQEKDRFVLSGKEDEIIYQITAVEDATGKEISYSLSDKEGKLSILLNDNNVVYPIKIITNITSTNPSAENTSVSTSAKGRGLSEIPDWMAESNQDGAYFGFSVSSAGDVNGDGYSDVIVGAYAYDNGQIDEGRAFAYYGSSSGFSAVSNWSAESNQDGAIYGYSVSSAGDVNGDGYSDVIVGAEGYDNGETNEGRAFVYHGSASGLSTSPNWSAESNQGGAWFGCSVSSAGNVNGDGYSDVIVGADSYDNGETNEGRAFVYHGSASGLSTSPNWSAESNQGGAWFGCSVSQAGDVNGDGYSDVIVGAPYYDNGQTSEGRAFVYHGSSSGLSLSSNWTAESDQEGALFGISVSSAGDVNGDGYSDVIVGAKGYDNGQQDEGRAFVYHGSSSGLSLSSNWTAESDQKGAWFGCSVSSAGDVNGDGYSDVIVGAPYYDNGQTDEGSAFVYYGSSYGLFASFNWTAESNQGGAYFGYSVSQAGDVNGDGYSDVIVGAYYYNNGQSEEGRAFVYNGSSGGLSTGNWSAGPDQEEACFGWSVSSAGDVNGDGYSDVIVGAYQYDNGETNEGRAFVYHGSSGGLSTSPNWMAESNQTNASFGYSVSQAGDVNGDGYSDVIVGAYQYNNGETNEGRAFVYNGSSGGLSTSPDWTAESNQEYAYFGNSVSSAGDVNGDGYSDVIIGARGYDNGETDEGRAFVYHGSSGGLSTSPNWTAESNQIIAYFGDFVSSAGDVNGDGYSDVIVGASYYDNGQTNEGMTFVYHGSSGGLSTSSNWTAESNQEYAYFGNSVSSAGDVNGDGYSDVIVGAQYYDNGETNEGMAFVYHGSSGGLSASPSWTAESNQDDAYFGSSVSSAGDVNGDGYSDVIVGADLYDYYGGPDVGHVLVYHGSASGLSSSPNWSAISLWEGAAHFGASVSSAGDVNGDGYSDVIVGAPYYDYGHGSEGRAFVYYGNNYGFSLIPSQLLTNGSHRVQLGNATGSGDVRLDILGKTPGGRGKVKLQWEIKELGQLFDGTSTSESDSWYDTGINGIPISEDITGLSEGTAYHWRMRLKYDPMTYNGSVYSRWLSIGPNGWNETDFITTDLSGIEEYADSEGNIKLSVFPSISTNIFGISFYISEEEAKEDISLKVYNKAGMVVKNLFTGNIPAGNHTMNWHGTDNSSQPLPDDIYFISLVKEERKPLVKKIVLLR